MQFVQRSLSLVIIGLIVVLVFSSVGSRQSASADEMPMNTNLPPVLITGLGVLVEPGVYRVDGYVTDEHPGDCYIQLSRILTSTIDVEVDGTFSKVVTIPYPGYLQLNAVDSEGAVSNPTFMFLQ